MKFIKDDYAVKLFLLVVLIAVAMVSLVIVFQNNFEDINLRYKDKVDELNNTFEQLVGAQSQLNRTLTDLEVNELKVEDLRGKYTEIRTERDLLDAERKRLNSEVEQKKSQIANLEFEKSELTERNDELSERNSDLQDENEDLRSRLDTCEESGGTNC